MLVAKLLVWQVALIGLSAVGLAVSRLPWRQETKADYFLHRFYGLVIYFGLLWIVGYTKILPLNLYIDWGLLGLLVVGSIVWLRQAKVKIDWRAWAISETVLFLIVLLILLFRGFNPTPLDGEKPMDIMMLSSVWRTTVLPPQDIWFAGRSVNYYYFGYFVFGSLGKLAGLTPLVMYSFGISTLWALIAVGLFGTVYKITGKVLAGILAAFLYLIAGNLDAIKQLTKVWPTIANFDWWASSRMIKDSITEFPAFSYLFADFHPHMMVAPWIILFTYHLSRAYEEKRLSFVGGLVAGIILGQIFVISTWSVITALLILVPALIYIKRIGWAPVGGVLGGLAIATFYLNHTTSIAKGFAPFIGHSEPAGWFLHWGILLIATLCYALTRKKHKLISICLLAGMILIVLPELVYVKDAYGSRYNTLFKMYYDAWLMMSIAGGVGLAYALAGKWYVKILPIVLIVVSICYVCLAYPVRYEKFKFWWGLDPTRVYFSKYPEEKPAYNKLINGHYIVFEKPGESFSGDNLLSAFTGSAMPYGWKGHESLWRDFVSYERDRLKQAEEIQGCDIGDDYVKSFHIDYCIDDEKNLIKLSH